MYRGYGNIDEIKLAKSEEEKEANFCRNVDDLKDNENNGFQNILMRACKKMKPFNNAIIQVSDDVYGEFLEKNRENVYKDCTVIVNGKFKIESCSIMLRAKSKFFDFLMSSKFKNAEIKN